MSDNMRSLLTRFGVTVFLALLGAFAVPSIASAAPTALTYTYDHHIFTLYPASYPEWRQARTQWYYQGVAAVPPARLLTCGKEGLADAPGWTRSSVTDWDEQAIARTIQKSIAAAFDRPAGNVRIRRNGSGSVVFEGRGLPGRSVDLAVAAQLTAAALEDDVRSITLPVKKVEPALTVEDPELQAMGIREVVTVGESVYAGSPKNRRHNIANGVNKFNGHIIPQGTVFSFNEVLGPVNAATGYLKELVIQGPQTIPDFGGGLCQVSTTAYRGPWEYGMPIVQRKNHSFAVQYYSPQGTDATIYPPSVDIKFRNDTPGALLIQSFTDEKDRAYFIYYGTKDGRAGEVFGPFITDRVAAPKEEKIEYSIEVAPGERKKVGDRHDGLKAMWYRSVQRPGTGATMESFFSSYEARPLYTLIGVAAGDNRLPTETDLSDEPPSWLPNRE